MSTCPYCDATAADAHEEIAHMRQAHPHVIIARLVASGELGPGRRVTVNQPALPVPGLARVANLPAPGTVVEVMGRGSWPIVVRLDDGRLVKAVDVDVHTT